MNKFQLKSLSLFISIMLFSIGFSWAQVYNLGNSSGTSAWYKLGTLSLPQHGADAIIKITAAEGYNATLNQLGDCVIRFRTSNDVDSYNGFYGTGSFYNTGRMKVVSAVRIIQVDRSTWDLYTILPVFTGQFANLVLTATGGSWTKNFTLVNPPTNIPFLELTEELIFSSSIYFNGNVGIGTITPREKLSVNGKIRAHEIKVETANWPDYVFEKTYQLPTLLETQTYIKKYGHLPGIPSAQEVNTDGIDLGEMNARLLQKIEELTLHLIEKEEEDKRIKEDLHEQKLIIQKLIIQVKEITGNKNK
ncbi:hypothetical protein [Pedobacter metabolipauper]|uniref:Uncharacterized protein n=1 Tax=Pedobacter metabolipauper TaxID=425513 RepID=A0A4V3D1K7_9SPHI|nr:hypothetical protein [Pedobacter metabolipauper]TDQ11553.1 hypothetical protein ATK78_0676 [Pedobacter metabolipauper]